MKFNLNRSTSKVFDSRKPLPKWFMELCANFADDNDIDQSRIGLSFLYSPSGLPELVNWMIKNDYMVSYWKTSAEFNSELPIAYGLDINDSCSKFMELRLKCE